MHMDDPADGAWAPGVGGARDEVHLQMCTNKFCTRCFWILNGATLKKKVGDWLDFKLDFASRHAAVGCSWCALAKDDPALERLGLFKTHNLGFAFYQMVHSRQNPLCLRRLNKHAQCPGHKACEAIINDAGVSSDGMPAFGDWEAVHELTLSGNATSIEGGAGVGRHKLRKMQWCLAEAKRDWNRQQLKSATCIAIMQDQRQSRFVLRFRSVDDNFEVATGLVDLSRVVGDVDYWGADAIRRATLLAIQRCCTPSHPPLAAITKKPDCDIELAVLVASKIECFAADGAADEQLAGRELSSTLGGATTTEIKDSIVKELPNLKVTRMQRTHASKRCVVILFNRQPCQLLTFRPREFKSARRNSNSKQAPAPRPCRTRNPRALPPPTYTQTRTYILDFEFC